MVFLDLRWFQAILCPILIKSIAPQCYVHNSKVVFFRKKFLVTNELGHGFNLPVAMEVGWGLGGEGGTYQTKGVINAGLFQEGDGKRGMELTAWNFVNRNTHTRTYTHIHTNASNTTV